MPTLVFLVGAEDCRAEYSIAPITADGVYTVHCDLTEYAYAANVEYVGILIYAESDVTLEVSRVTAGSDTEDGATLLSHFHQTNQTTTGSRYSTYVAYFVVLVVIFTDLPGFFGMLRGLEAILEPLILGAVFAFLLNPIVRFVDTRLGPLLGAKTKWKAQAVRNVSRGAGVVTAVIVAALILYAFFSMLLPQLYESVVGIVDNAENYYMSIDRWVTNVLEDNPEIQGYVDSALGKIYEFINNWITTTFLQDVQKLLATVTTSVVAVVKSLMNVLIGLVASVYILWSKETFQAQGKKIIVAAFSRKGADHIFYLGRNIYRVFNGFVIGKIVDSAIIGVLCYIGILILKMPYPALIATVIGVTNVIPFFGPIIGLVPCAFLILLVNPLQAFYFVIFILVLQQVDGNVIGPKILGNTVGISGFWVLASITIAASLFGFTGMILGVPVFAILYLLISDSVNEKLRKKSLTTDTRAYRDIQTVDELPKTEETGEK